MGAAFRLCLLALFVVFERTVGVLDPTPVPTPTYVPTSDPTGAGSLTASVTGVATATAAATDNIPANGLPVCPPDSAGASLWPLSSPGAVVKALCNQADANFTRQLFPQLTRTCLDNGRWSAVDFIGCTAADTWTKLRVPYTSVAITTAHLTGAGVTVTFKAVLNKTALILPEMLPYVDNALSSAVFYTSFSVWNESSGHQIIIPADSCQCRQTLGVLVSELCIGTFNAPCSCSPNACQCQPPYVGDGNRCTIDVDGDGYPNNPLNTCTNGSNMIFCIKDVCPDVFNPNQSSLECQDVAGFSGCRYGRDATWSILWGNTPFGASNRQRCPNGPDFATRFCSSNGWERPNLSMCQSYAFNSIQIQATTGLFNPKEKLLPGMLQDAATVLESVFDFSSIPSGPSTLSLLPLDLNLTNYVMRAAITLVGDSLLDGTVNATDLPIMSLVNVFNNILDSSNLQGWLDLEEINSGTQLLLSNAEKCGLYLSKALSANQSSILSGSNIVFAIQKQNGSYGQYTFPQSLVDLQNFSREQYIPAQITIPLQLLYERGQETGTVPVTTILFRSMESVLPLNRTNTSIASMVISAQVVSQSESSFVLKQTPTTIKFTFNSTMYNSTVAKYQCVYWQADSKNISNGYWSAEGLVTVNSVTSNDGLTEVQCQSSHLTSFAVLVDVSGTFSSSSTKTSLIPAAEIKALSIVSYIGCSISIVSLAIAVVFFLSLRKTLFKAVNNFIHLNLALSLMFAYLVFAVGIETAASSHVGCIFVATLLHYLLLASFSWMLCEGIMLFLMLVIVFSAMAKRWWVFLLLGWGLPLPVVIISVSARYDQYGVKDSTGAYTYCWLSTSSGLIWAFVGPMLLIIAVNIIFLIMALCIVFKTKKALRKGRKTFWTLLCATVVLLPLLGLTWVFGLLVVDSNTTVFAWLFTIFNSLQGFFILVFHVLRNDKFLRSKLVARLLRRKYIITTTYSKSSSTVKFPLEPKPSFLSTDASVTSNELQLEQVKT